MATPKEMVDHLISGTSIIIFSKSFCPFCNRVKGLFNSLEAKYSVIELDLMGDNGNDIQQHLYDRTGQKTVPSVFIHGNHIGGCDSVFKAHEDGLLVGMINPTAGISPTLESYDFDLLVIGGGSGGLAASKEAASHGKSVAVCDFVHPTPTGTSWGLGGTCVNVGCIPKKLMHRAALCGEDIHDSSEFGWELGDSVKHNWSTMVNNVQMYIKSLNFGYRKSLREASVTYLNAYAVFMSPNKVKVTDKKGIEKEVTARRFLIAAGCRPKYPNITGAREFGITSDDLFSLDYCPGKTLIVGASYISLECAGFLQGLGLDVTVMVRSILLRGFDQEMAELVGTSLKERGVHFIRGCVPTSIEKVSDGRPATYKVTGLNDDGTSMTGEFNTVVFAIGREACTKDMGLGTVGVTAKTTNNKIVTNMQDETSAANIYAIGDVVDGKPELTPVAIQAGKLLAQRLYGGASELMDYKNVPTTVFTPLEYGCVGLSEEDAIETYGEANVEVYHNIFKPLEVAFTKNLLFKSFSKLICLKEQGERVVGFHILSPNAGEITQGFALAVKLGAKKHDFDSLVGIHPTSAEVFTTMTVTKSSGASVEKTDC